MLKKEYVKNKQGSLVPPYQRVAGPRDPKRGSTAAEGRRSPLGGAAGSAGATPPGAYKRKLERPQVTSRKGELGTGQGGRNLTKKPKN
jgi:hypothetical protein